MKLPERKQRWVYHAEALPQAAGEGVTRRVLAYTDGLMCVENTFEKGAVGALHHHPHTQITYVVSGAFDFTVDGVTRRQVYVTGLHRVPRALCTVSEDWKRATRPDPFLQNRKTTS